MIFYRYTLGGTPPGTPLNGTVLLLVPVPSAYTGLPGFWVTASGFAVSLYYRCRPAVCVSGTLPRGFSRSAVEVPSTCLRTAPFSCGFCLPACRLLFRHHRRNLPVILPASFLGLTCCIVNTVHHLGPGRSIPVHLGWVLRSTICLILESCHSPSGGAILGGWESLLPISAGLTLGGFSSHLPLGFRLLCATWVGCCLELITLPACLEGGSGLLLPAPAGSACHSAFPGQVHYGRVRDGFHLRATQYACSAMPPATAISCFLFTTCTTLHFTSPGASADSTIHTVPSCRSFTWDACRLTCLQ